MKIGFIGGGNMAEALIRGMTSEGMKNIIVSELHRERRSHLSKKYGVDTSESSAVVTKECSIIILAVKPQSMTTVLDEISGDITDNHTIASIAAGITLSYLQSKLRTSRIIRVMPNTPALVQKGMTVMSLCECFSDRELSAVREIFMSVGEVITVPEKHMDAVTALSGSGPAFFSLFVEKMIEAGRVMGLNSSDAETLAIQTAIGTSALLESGMSPSHLRQMVTSPGGTTAAGLQAFQDEGLQHIVNSAISAAAQRSKELGKSA